jgi:hypothetical protein
MLDSIIFFIIQISLRLCASCVSVFFYCLGASDSIFKNSFALRVYSKYRLLPICFTKNLYIFNNYLYKKLIIILHDNLF